MTAAHDQLCVVCEKPIKGDSCCGQTYLNSIGNGIFIFPDSHLQSVEKELLEVRKQRDELLEAAKMAFEELDPWEVDPNKIEKLEKAIANAQKLEE